MPSYRRLVKENSCQSYVEAACPYLTVASSSSSTIFWLSSTSDATSFLSVPRIPRYAFVHVIFNLRKTAVVRNGQDFTLNIGQISMKSSSRRRRGVGALVIDDAEPLGSDDR